MVARAVSARDWLTPLAVLVPILGTVVGGIWALTRWPPLVLLVIVGGLAVTAMAGKGPYGARVSLVVAILALVAGFIGLFVALVIGFNTSICGKTISGAWAWVPLAGGALVYFGLGSYGLRTGRSLYVVPLALLSGVLTALLLVALVPGTPGYCD